MQPKWEFGEFTVTTDLGWFDEEMIHQFLTESYWAKGIPRDVVARSIRNSLCFAVMHGSKQVGFARVISDYSTYAYLADVFILESHRGRGLSKFLMECIVSHPQLQGLRRWTLATRVIPSGLQARGICICSNCRFLTAKAVRNDNSFWISP